MLISSLLAPIMFPAVYHTYDELNACKSFIQRIKTYFIKDFVKTFCLGFIVLTLLILLLSFIKIFATNKTFFCTCLLLFVWCIWTIHKKCQ